MKRYGEVPQGAGHFEIAPAREKRMTLRILRWDKKAKSYKTVQEIEGDNFSTINVDYVRGTLKHYKPSRPAYADEIWIFVNGPYSLVAHTCGVSLYLRDKTSYRAENPNVGSAA